MLRKPKWLAEKSAALKNPSRFFRFTTSVVGHLINCSLFLHNASTPDGLLERQYIYPLQWCPPQLARNFHLRHITKISRLAWTVLRPYFSSCLDSFRYQVAINSIEFLLKRYLVFSFSISPRNWKFLGGRAPANAAPPKSGNPAKNAIFSLTPSLLSKRSGIMEGIRI